MISNKKELLNNLENSVFLKSPILKTERIKNSLTKINEDLVKIYVNLMRNKKLEIDKYSKSLEILNARFGQGKAKLSVKSKNED